MVIENVHNFLDFCKALVLQGLRSENFFELADNGLLSCITVVGFNSRKRGLFKGHLCVARCARRPVGLVHQFEGHVEVTATFLP
jgi:hypothetical protein